MPPALQNPFLLWLVLSVALAVLCYFGVRKELRLRGTLYGAFILACVVAMWPPYGKDDKPGKIHLGLDLKGGIHLVLQVVTDDALNATVDDAVSTARAQATAKGISFSGARRVDASSFAVEGVEPARVKDVRDILKDFFRSPEWDVREQGDGKFLVKMTDAFVNQVRDRTVKEAIRTLERRVNQLGVAEPVIAQHGPRGDQILVQLPGVTDVEQAKRVISTTAQLSLKLVEDSAGTREALLDKTQGKAPDNMEVVQGQGREAGQPEFYLVRKEAVITGRDLKNARAGVDPQTNAPDVQFTLNPGGAEKFKRETGRNIGRRLAIILDGSVASAPNINSQIGAEGVITGRFSVQEADELAKILRAGALPATLKYLQELTVGASLGRDSIRQGVTAAAMGMAFLTIFMLLYYRHPDRGRGRGHQRARVRAHSRGAAQRQDGQGRHQQRLRPRVDHHPRHPRHRPHRRRLPLPVRHGAGEGIRGDAGDRPRGQHLRVLFRQPLHLRVGPGQAPGRHSQHLRAAPWSS